MKSEVESLIARKSEPAKTITLRVSASDMRVLEAECSDVEVRTGAKLTPRELAQALLCDGIRALEEANH